MDFWEFLRILLRRWYVVVPVLLVAAGLGVTLPERVPPTYTATGTMLVVGPNDGATEVDNPFRAVGLGGNAEALAILAGDKASKSAVESAGLSTAYSVEQVSLNSPTLVVEAEAGSPEAATETVDFLIDEISTRFEALQAGAAVEPPAFLQVQRLSGEAVPAAVYTGRLRTLLLIAVVGVVTAAMAALAVEGWARRSGRRPSRLRRPRRRARRREPRETDYQTGPVNGERALENNLSPLPDREPTMQ